LPVEAAVFRRRHKCPEFVITGCAAWLCATFIERSASAPALSNNKVLMKLPVASAKRLVHGNCMDLTTEAIAIAVLSSVADDVGEELIAIGP
jgi:hypothetical protein